jgi:4-hydroxy-4-methyl-2-oxoglutarate aldolase
MAASVHPQVVADLTPDLESRLARLDVCAVSDALDRLGLAPAVSGLVNLTVRKRISGPVITVKLHAVTPTTPPSTRHLCSTAIESASPGSVIVIEQRSGVEAAGWGGLLSRAAVLQQVSGVICEGWVRDVDEAIDLGFPVFARAATARTARGRIIEVSTNEVIRVGHVEVAAGDWVIADRTGVAFIPSARANEVIQIAEQIAGREAAIAEAVDAGTPIGTAMGANYERLVDREPS